MVSIVVDVSLDGLCVNGRLLEQPVRPSEYATILGTQPRVLEPSPPALSGHPNNRIHLFDELGLYLVEHLATHLVDAVVFVLWLEESPFQLAREYAGELTIGGVRFFPGMEHADFAGESTILFKGPILGIWYIKTEAISIGLRDEGLRRPSGRRRKRLRFADVTICISPPSGR